MSDELNQLRERNARLTLLNEVSNVIHATLDSQQALDLILREAVLPEDLVGVLPGQRGWTTHRGATRGELQREAE